MVGKPPVPMVLTSHNIPFATLILVNNLEIALSHTL